MWRVVTHHSAVLGNRRTTQNTGSSLERWPPRPPAPQNRVHRGRRPCAFPGRRVVALLLHDTLDSG